MKANCANCHFFIRDTMGHKLLINDEKRKLACEDDFSWVKSLESLSCYFGVWDEGYTKIERDKEIVQKTRKDFCFYWRYRPGMLLNAAETLQERESQKRETRKERILTILGLWIAALALLGNIIVNLLKQN